MVKTKKEKRRRTRSLSSKELPKIATAFYNKQIKVTFILDDPHIIKNEKKEKKPMTPPRPISKQVQQRPAKKTGSMFSPPVWKGNFSYILKLFFLFAFQNSQKQSPKLKTLENKENEKMEEMKLEKECETETVVKMEIDHQEKKPIPQKSSFLIPVKKPIKKLKDLVYALVYNARNPNFSLKEHSQVCK